VTVTPPETVPALVLAQELYGDATRDAEIINRNAIRNPAAIVGSEPLSVLSNA
jgi:prophage DNA circulation protein